MQCGELHWGALAEEFRRGRMCHRSRTCGQVRRRGTWLLEPCPRFLRALDWVSQRDCRQCVWAVSGSASSLPSSTRFSTCDGVDVDMGWWVGWWVGASGLGIRMLAINMKTIRRLFLLFVLDSCVTQLLCKPQARLADTALKTQPLSTSCVPSRTQGRPDINAPTPTPTTPTRERPWLQTTGAQPAHAPSRHPDRGRWGR